MSGEGIDEGGKTIQPPSDPDKEPGRGVSRQCRDDRLDGLRRSVGDHGVDEPVPRPVIECPAT